MRRILVLGFCVVVGLAAAPVQAGPITIGNASFELPDTPTYNGGPITGWAQVGVSGVFQPNAYQPVGTLSPNVGAGFIAGVVGAQTAYINSGSISWTSLSDTLAAGTYTLQVRVGDRLDTAAPAYSIGLLAGSTLIDFAVTPMATVNDGWVIATLTTAVLAGNPNIGNSLGIRLALNGGGQVNFDDVRLDFEPAVAVPEPASLLLFGTGLVGLRVWRKRRG